MINVEPFGPAPAVHARSQAAALTAVIPASSTDAIRLNQSAMVELDAAEQYRPQSRAVAVTSVMALAPSPATLRGRNNLLP